jgi:hypothetical protein
MNNKSILGQRFAAWAAVMVLSANAAIAVAKTVPGAVTVDLGDAATVTSLFSYPNSDKPQTLAQTVQLYLQQSTQRDTLAGTGVAVGGDTGGYTATFSGSGVPDDYGDRLSQFLRIGSEGVAAQARMQQDGKWDSKDWRLFLPLGLAMADQKSVQLLHFPPDTSLTQQDYLDSATSRRWESLLELNGASKAEVALYERIVDIAPIAAPASAGNSLAAAYGYFRDYAFDMLSYSVQPRPAPAKPLPVVAYGSPVRQWVQDNLKAKLPVLGTAYVQVGQTASVPFLGANHPSYIWYAAKQSRTLALRTMRDDLASACWQVKTAADPGLDIKQAVSQCAAYWDQRDEQVCELTEIQAYEKTPEEARQICAKSAKGRLRAARGLTVKQVETAERGAPGHVFAR